MQQQYLGRSSKMQRPDGHSATRKSDAFNHYRRRQATAYYEYRCCYLQSWDPINFRAWKDHCTIVVVDVGKPPEQPLDQWLHALPTNITALDLSSNALTGTLSSAFKRELKVLILGNNSFVSTIPESWGRTGLRAVDVSQGNRIIGSLPSLWLDNFNCTHGSCNEVNGNPKAATEMLLLSEQTKTDSPLPYRWISEDPALWDTSMIVGSPHYLVLGSRSDIKALPESLCLARGSSLLRGLHPKLYTILGKSWFYLRDDPKAIYSEANLRSDLISLGYPNVTSYGTNPCVNPHRCFYISMVYGLFALVLLCAVVYVFFPTRWIQLYP